MEEVCTQQKVNAVKVLKRHSFYFFANTSFQDAVSRVSVSHSCPEERLCLLLSGSNLVFFLFCFLSSQNTIELKCLCPVQESVIFFYSTKQLGALLRHLVYVHVGVSVHVFLFFLRSTFTQLRKFCISQALKSLESNAVYFPPLVCTTSGSFVLPFSLLLVTPYATSFHAARNLFGAVCLVV